MKRSPTEAIHRANLQIADKDLINSKFDQVDRKFEKVFEELTTIKGKQFMKEMEKAYRQMWGIYLNYGKL